MKSMNYDKKYRGALFMKITHNQHLERQDDVSE